MQTLTVVNASTLVSDDEVRKKVAALQVQVDRDFLPAWGHDAVPVKIVTAGRDDIGTLPRETWPVFLNRHSTDPGALGWHTMDGLMVYGRVFVGDCLRYGVDWGTDLGHEVLETILDPTANKVYVMPDGRHAAFEACDAVEADNQAYDGLDGVKLTNFVLPDYFSTRLGGKYDFRGQLKGPCPALTPGGYMSIWVPGMGWSQVQEDRADGLAGRRAIRVGQQAWRRQMRSRVGLGTVLRAAA